MSIKHSFSVAENKDATSHNLTVEIPTFDESTEQQRRNAWEKAIDGWTIQIQNPLRSSIGKGVKGEKLQKEAQTRMTAAVNKQRVQTVQVVPQKIDATAMKLTREQIDLLTAEGAEVHNIPEGI